MGVCRAVFTTIEWRRETYHAYSDGKYFVPSDEIGFVDLYLLKLYKRDCSMKKEQNRYADDSSYSKTLCYIRKQNGPSIQCNPPHVRRKIVLRTGRESTMDRRYGYKDRNLGIRCWRPVPRSKRYRHDSSDANLTRVTHSIEFLIENIENPWAFESSYDLVHSRLSSGNRIRSWPRYLSEAVED